MRMFPGFKSRCTTETRAVWRCARPDATDAAMRNLFLRFKSILKGTAWESLESLEPTEREDESGDESIDGGDCVSMSSS